jgi:glycosyltransferase involved in cell wall biosynthesis
MIQHQLHGSVSPSQPFIVAVIPAYNEERFIASVVIKTRLYASRVLIIDDGSSDRTAELAEAAGADVIRQQSNGGKAKALNAGFQAALRLNPDVIVCLDGDAQHEPAEIPTVCQPILEGAADVVVGSRFLGTESDIPRWRQVGQHTLTAVTNTLSGTHITDSQSGYRAFSTEAAQALHFQSTGLSVESEMQFLFKPAGMRVVEVPISVQYLDGNKRNPVVHGLQVLDAMLSMVARRRPLAFISLPGFILLFIGLLLGIRVIWLLGHTGEVAIGFSVLTALLEIGGLILGVTGILLHSMERFARLLKEELDAILEKFSVTTR